MLLRGARLSLAIATIAICGCSSSYTVSDGTYLFSVTDDLGTRSRSAEVTKPARGKIMIVINPGDPDDESARCVFQGQLTGNKFYSEESFHHRVTMKWNGIMTANDQMEGTLETVEMGGQPKTATWKLVKQE